MGIAAAEKVDLIEFDVAVLGGIERDAMIDGQRDMAIVEKRDQVIEVLEGRAASGDDDRLFRLCHLFDQNPVGTVRTGKFEDGDSELAAEVNRILIEWSCHRDATGFADGLYQSGEVLRLEARVERFLDVADIVAVTKIPVDEAVNVAQLQFDGGAHIVEAYDLRIVADDLQAALKVSQVVVGHFENE